jgi:hypothetical protein
MARVRRASHHPGNEGEDDGLTPSGNAPARGFDFRGPHGSMLLSVLSWTTTKPGAQRGSKAQAETQSVDPPQRLAPERVRRSEVQEGSHDRLGMRPIPGANRVSKARTPQGRGRLPWGVLHPFGWGAAGAALPGRPRRG